VTSAHIFEDNDLLYKFNITALITAARRENSANSGVSASDSNSNSGVVLQLAPRRRSSSLSVLRSLGVSDGDSA
jgi:hypothetical protein